MTQEAKNIEPAPGFKVRAYSPKQLSELYEVSAKTLARWLKPILPQIGKREGRYYNISQIRCIVAHLGVPANSTLQ